MTKQLRMTVAVGLSVVMAVVLSGCCTGRIRLCHESVVSVAGRPSDKVQILWAHVWQTEEEVIVCGALRRRAYRIPLELGTYVFALGLRINAAS